MEEKKGGGCFATGTEMQKSRSSVERNGDGVSSMVKENLVQFSNKLTINLRIDWRLLYTHTNKCT